MTRFTVLFVLALAAAGCGETDPYLHKPGEFNRNLPTFNQEPTDLTEVTVCYSSLASSTEGVAAVAAERCRQFGRSARLRSYGYTDCPLLTPVAAHFDCVKE
jgi:hypothetical protein